MRNFKCVVLLFLITSVIVLGHHSGVMFDRDKEVSLKGTVQEFVFVNPHVSIRISVIDSNGISKDWSFEAASTQALVRSGWRKSTLKVGDTVTIVGHPLKDGRTGAQLMRAILADGTVMEGATGGNY